jgi:hypothetical protein
MTQELTLDETGIVAKAGVHHVIFILDRSGSMQGSEADVIGGFNAYIEELRKDAEPGFLCGVSYVRFDHVIELAWNDRPLADVPPMTHADYQPRGSTALLDAVGMTVSAITPRHDATFTVVVHTDGMENASREWTTEKLRKLIEERRALGNWTFTFYGCDVDMWEQARDFGVPMSSTASYARSDTKRAYRSSGHLEALMRKKGMRYSERTAELSKMAMDGASDAELEREIDAEKAQQERSS